MSRYEVRCHEWGDDSDYHWTYCKTKEEAQSIVDEYGNIYESFELLRKIVVICRFSKISKSSVYRT